MTAKIKLIALLASAIIHIAITSSVFATGGIRTVALSGAPVPKIDGEYFNDFFSVPILNNNGKVAFVSNLAGIPNYNGTSNLFAIFAERNTGGLEMVAQERDQVPDAPPETYFGDFNNRHLGLVYNDLGQTAFISPLTGATVDVTNNTAIFSEGGNNGLTLVARSGDIAPFTNQSFGGFRRPLYPFQPQRGPLLDGQGQTVFMSGGGVFRYKPNQGLELIHLESDLFTNLPGSNDGTIITSYSHQNTPHINANGTIAYIGRLEGPNVDNRLGSTAILLKQEGGSLELIARAGDPIPGLPDNQIGVGFSGLYTPFIGNSEHVIFMNNIEGEDVVDDENDFTLFRKNAGGSLEIVARYGDQAPGLIEGLLFGEISIFGSFISPTMNESGKLAFIASITDQNLTGLDAFTLFSESINGDLTLLAREGDPAPLPPEFPSAYFRYFSSTRPPIINNLGQTAFQPELYNGSENIFAQDIYGNLQFIAGSGMVIDVSDNPLAPDLRTIRSVDYLDGGYVIDSFFNNPVGRGFNDRGQLAFKAVFTDGTSGIFVSNRVAVPIPEPTTLAFVVIALGLFPSRKVSNWCDSALLHRILQNYQI